MILHLFAARVTMPVRDIHCLVFALENCHSCWRSCREQGISGGGVTTLRASHLMPMAAP